MLRNRPHITRTQLVQSTDRGKRLLAFNNNHSSIRKPELKNTSAFADIQHLKCHLVARSPNGKEKCCASTTSRKNKSVSPKLNLTLPPQSSPPSLSLPPILASSARLPPRGFTYYLTLSSKFFSTFPHGTCSLSVSWSYLVLDGVYHLIWAALPSNPTLRTKLTAYKCYRTGLAPSMGDGPVQEGLG